MRNNNEINVSFVSKSKDLMKVKYVELKVFDPNTDAFEVERVDVNVLGEDDEFGKIVGQICAQQHLTKNIGYGHNKEEVIDISKTFSVLHKSTAMIAKVKLSD